MATGGSGKPVESSPVSPAQDPGPQERQGGVGGGGGRCTQGSPSLAIPAPPPHPALPPHIPSGSRTTGGSRPSTRAAGVGSTRLPLPCQPREPPKPSGPEVGSGETKPSLS